MIKADRNSVLLSILIMLQPLLDIFSYFAIQLGMTTVTSLLRLAIFGIIMLYAFLLSDKKKVYCIFAAVIGVYFVLRAIVNARDGYALVSDVNGFLRTVQLPAMTLAFITLFRKAKAFPENLGRMFIINYIIIGASIILSFLIGKPVYTYYPDVGIKGWFYTGNSQSCILSIMALPALCYCYKKNDDLLFILTLVVAGVQMFLFGTQVALWSLFLVIGIFLVLLVWNREKKWAMLIALTVALLAVIIARPFSPSAQITSAEEGSLTYWENFLNEHPSGTTDPTEDPTDPTDSDTDQEKPIPPSASHLIGTLVEPLVRRFGYKEVLEVYGGDISAAELMDNRLMKVNFGKLAMAEKDFWHLLFGMEDRDIYIGNDSYDPENDFPALFFFYGIVGIVLYVAFLAYFAWLLLKDILKSLKKLPAEQVLIALNLVLAMGIAELSANVLRRPNVSIYISLLLAYAYYVCRVRKEQAQ